MIVEINGNEVEVRLFDQRADATYILAFSTFDPGDARLLAELLEETVIHVDECQ